jgi:ADP-ribose pyrophosphatase YjhB (NUDIX family)
MAARRELLEETGLSVGELYFCAHVDTIRRDDDGRVRFHYTILDFAGLWTGGEPIAGSDVSEVQWAPLDNLAPYDLWTEAHRVIGIARRLVGSK